MKKRVILKKGIKKAIFKSMLIFLIISIPLLLNIASFRILLYQKDFYGYQFSRLGVFEKIGNADEINSDILDYFYSSENELEIKEFNERELSHLEDVKHLIRNILLFSGILLMLSIGIAATLWMYSNKDFWRSMIWGNITNIILIVGLYIGSYFQYDILFEKFHEMFFEEGTWTFGWGEKMVQVYPEAFFQNYLGFIILLSLILSLISLVVTTWLLKRKKIL